MGNIIPLNVPREVTVDTTVAGYHLPKVIRDSQPQIFKLILLNGRNLTQKSDTYSCPRESLNWEIHVIHFFLHVWSLEYQFNQILIILMEGKGYSQVKYDQAKTSFSLLWDLAVFLPRNVHCEYLCVYSKQQFPGGLCHGVLLFSLVDSQDQGPSRLWKILLPNHRVIEY